MNKFQWSEVDVGNHSPSIFWTSSCGTKMFMDRGRDGSISSKATVTLKQSSSNPRDRTLILTNEVFTLSWNVKSTSLHVHSGPERRNQICNGWARTWTHLVTDVKTSFMIRQWLGILLIMNQQPHDSQNTSVLGFVCLSSLDVWQILTNIQRITSSKEPIAFLEGGKNPTKRSLLTQEHQGKKHVPGHDQQPPPPKNEAYEEYSSIFTHPWKKSFFKKRAEKHKGKTKKRKRRTLESRGNQSHSYIPYWKNLSSKK